MEIPEGGNEMRSTWTLAKSACLGWIMNRKEGLEIKLASLHCGIVWGLDTGSRALWISSVMS